MHHSGKCEFYYVCIMRWRWIYLQGRVDLLIYKGGGFIYKGSGIIYKDASQLL